MVQAQLLDPRAERDRQRAEAAFLDYIRAKDHYQKPKYTVAALWQFYQEFPERAVTKHKPDLSRWRKEYDWDKRALEMDRKLRETELKDLEKLRRFRIDHLASYSGDAVETMHEVMVDPNVNPRVRLAAAELALALIGISPKRSESNDENAVTEPPPPDADAPEDEQLRYYASQKK
jgi:HrpA-like RNA helicase